MKRADFSVFKNRKVLVTGHTGFKGAWLSVWLKHLGAEVQGVALDPHTTPSLYEAGAGKSVSEDHRCDIRNHDELLSLLQILNPEIIFHLAAQPIVRQSYTLARETFETNVMGTVHVLECARQVPSVQAVVHVSTDKCYEPTQKAEGYSESDPLGGHDPYSSSKAAAEMAVQSYIRSFCTDENELLIASGRAGNVIGGGDWSEDRIVPDCVRALESGGSISVRNPAHVRPWQHVLEALSGYLSLGAVLLKGDKTAMGPWNFGPTAGNVKTVKDLTEGFIKHWGTGEWHHVKGADALHEAELLTLDSSKAREQLGWRPRWDFEQTVRKTAEWYRSFSRKEDAVSLCLNDINDYMSRQSTGQ